VPAFIMLIILLPSYFVCPELSHLSQKDATVLQKNFVEIISGEKGPVGASLQTNSNVK
jgi:hypothetical protein